MAHTLAEITAAVAAAVPGADYAEITRTDGPDRVVAHAPTHPIAYALAELQSVLREGPCLAALDAQHTIGIPDLRTDRRWPTFVARAAEFGMASMLCLPLLLAHDTRSALTLYAGTPGAFTSDDETLAGMFATHAASMLHDATAPEPVEPVAATAHIEQAKGVLMARQKLSADQASEALKQTARHTHQPVADLADECVGEPASSGPPTPSRRPPVELRPNSVGNPTVLGLAGDLDAATTPALHEQLQQLPTTSDLVLDLSQVEFLGTAALSLLREWHHRLDAGGATLYLAAPPAPTHRILTVLGLTDELPCASTLNEALAHLADTPHTPAPSGGTDNIGATPVPAGSP